LKICTAAGERASEMRTRGLVIFCSFLLPLAGEGGPEGRMRGKC
jgi:hypothetical protein